MPSANAKKPAAALAVGRAALHNRDLFHGRHVANVGVSGMVAERGGGAGVSGEMG